MKVGIDMSFTIEWNTTCGTCQNAKKWIDAKGLDYNAFHLVEHPPTKDELIDLIDESGLPPKKFFNTSGKKYRELNLKEKIKDADKEEMADILATDGMLIKRQRVTDGSHITVGIM